MNLIIVESPTKARKLTSYLGSGYTVKASVGHVRDLPKSKLGVDVENNYEPVYEVDPGKTKVIKELRDIAKKSKEIYLAMDPDREGEAIAWHVKFLLENSTSSKKSKNKSSKNSKAKSKRFLRATFHEITKPAVKKAIENPGSINMDLVDAQQARRVVDRLVGYKISPVLWKKVRRGLSAGRVQSVALRLIVEREREIEAFKPDEYWEVDVLLSQENALYQKSNNSKKEKEEDAKPDWMDNVPEDMFIARVIEVDKKKYEPKKEKDVTGVVKVLEAKSTEHTVESIEKKQRKRRSLAPFTTSTLQQTAATRLGMTSKQTMRLAQQLYEEGLITYHRTDSVNLSKQAIGSARAYIEKAFGKKYLPKSWRVFSSKSKNAQEAHEAIRVTDVTLQSDGLHERAKLTKRHEQLYDLIWRRFVASQMEHAVYDQTTIIVKSHISSNKLQTHSKSKMKNIKLRSSGSILTFDGWMKLFPTSNDTFLPDLDENQTVYCADVNPQQKFTQPPPRYNDASLVKELEKKGIGRPSTYASIISVIENRGYVDREGRAFKATLVGSTVNDFLMKHFESIMDYDFTAEMEEDLDRIARGERKWRKVVGEFYSPLEKKIEKVEDKAERMKVPVEKTGEKCPDCQKLVKAGELKKSEAGEIVIRTGKYGKFKSCERFPECKFTENIVETLDDRKCPLCKKGDIVIKPTRWRRSFYGCSEYPKCDWASWKKPDPGLSLTKKEWEKEKKRREERKKKYKKKGKRKGKK